MKKFSKKLLEFFPIIFAIVFVSIPNQSEFTTAIILIITAIITFLIRHDKNEWLVFVAGIILGTFVETFGDQFNQLQYWTQDTMFGIPLWLPIFWGIGFVYIRRIGNYITNCNFKKSSKHKSKK